MLNNVLPDSYDHGRKKSNELGLVKIARLSNTSFCSDLIVRNGNDVCLLPKVNCASQLVSPWVAHIFTDRSLYKQGETIHLKGWIRRVDFSNGGECSLQLPGATTTTCSITDCEGEAVANAEFPVSADMGAFEGHILLASVKHVGPAILSFYDRKGILITKYSVDFAEYEVQDFEMDLSIEDPSSSVHLLESKVLARLTAKFRTGRVHSYIHFGYKSIDI